MAMVDQFTVLTIDLKVNKAGTDSGALAIDALGCLYLLLKKDLLWIDDLPISDPKVLGDQPTIP